MIFDPIEFCELAVNLHFSAGATQSHYRSAISRAYYGAFLIAKKSANIATTSKQVHEDTIQYFLSKGSTKVGNNLHDLRRLRNDADYEMQMFFGASESGKALKLAKQITEKLGHPFPPKPVKQ